jgi:hypothetical protein
VEVAVGWGVAVDVAVTVFVGVEVGATVGVAGLRFLRLSTQPERRRESKRKEARSANDL